MDLPDRSNITGLRKPAEELDRVLLRIYEMCIEADEAQAVAAEGGEGMVGMGVVEGDAEKRREASDAA